MPIPEYNVHPIPAEEENAEAAARKYEEELKTIFHITGDELPRFDLILLGLGEDGHTASLFPGNGVLTETRLLAAGVKQNKIWRDRITLTLPVINQGRNVFFLVSGENKAGVLAQVIHKKDGTLPAARIAPKSGNLVFLLDLEASLQLVLTRP